jgi:hypothetical protein
MIFIYLPGLLSVTPHTMPRQLLSARPQRQHLSDEEHVQNEFIKALGPYFACAKFDDHGPEFLARTFNVWFARWPLKLADFEDADFMQHRRQCIESVCLYFVLSLGIGHILSVRIFLAVYGGHVSLE